MGVDLPGAVDVAFKSLEIIAFVGGGIFAVYRFGRVMERVENQLHAMQQEIARQGKVLEALADVKGEMKLMAERALRRDDIVAAQGKRLDDITALVMNETWGKRASSDINRIKGIKD